MLAVRGALVANGLIRILKFAAVVVSDKLGGSSDESERFYRGAS